MSIVFITKQLNFSYFVTEGVLNDPQGGQPLGKPWQSWLADKQPLESKLVSLMAEIFINMLIVWNFVHFVES